MPLIARVTADHSIREFRNAAWRRYQEARRLAINGDRLAAIYLWGYAAEMLLKAAYFRLVGWSPTQAMPRLGAPPFTTALRLKTTCA